MQINQSFKQPNRLIVKPDGLPTKHWDSKQLFELQPPELEIRKHLGEANLQRYRLFSRWHFKKSRFKSAHITEAKKILAFYQPDLTKINKCLEVTCIQLQYVFGTPTFLWMRLPPMCSFPKNWDDPQHGRGILHRWSMSRSRYLGGGGNSGWDHRICHGPSGRKTGIWMFPKSSMD